jgi:hypothetical protein
MTQIFISYSRKDLTFIERLAADLKSVGFDVWYDVSNLGGGSRWNKATIREPYDRLLNRRITYLIF